MLLLLQPLLLVIIIGKVAAQSVKDMLYSLLVDVVSFANMITVTPRALPLSLWPALFLKTLALPPQPRPPLPAHVIYSPLTL